MDFWTVVGVQLLFRQSSSEFDLSIVNELA